MFYLLWSSGDVSLEESNKSVDVSGSFPQDRDEEEVEQLHVGLRHVTHGMVLEQQRQNLEHVGHELLHILKIKTNTVGIGLPALP